MGTNGSFYSERRLVESDLFWARLAYIPSEDLWFIGSNDGDVGLAKDEAVEGAWDVAFAPAKMRVTPVDALAADIPIYPDFFPTTWKPLKTFHISLDKYAIAYGAHTYTIGVTDMPHDGREQRWFVMDKIKDEQHNIVGLAHRHLCRWLDGKSKKEDYRAWVMAKLSGHLQQFLKDKPGLRDFIGPSSWFHGEGHP